MRGIVSHPNIRCAVTVSITRASTSPAIYDDEKIGAIKPYPHVAETLSALRDRGLKLGVVTDAHNGNALKRLRKAGLEE